MKTKYLLPFLGFGLIGNQIAQAQISDKDSSKAKQTARNFLLPFDSFYNAWSTGTTLTKYTLDINGPVNYDLRDKNGIKGSISPANFKKVKETFKKSNSYFKTDSARAQFDKELSQYPLLPKNLTHILDDGKILSKEEMDSLNALPDNEYILPFVYKSKSESVFGFARIIKRGKNFDYELLFGKNFEIGAGYEFSEPRSANLNLRTKINNYILGLCLGYGEKSFDSPITTTISPRNPVTGLQGENTEKTQDRNNLFYIDGEFGYNFGKVSLISELGYQTGKLQHSREASVIIKDINNQIVAKKTKPYNDEINLNGIRYGFGFDLNLGRISIGPRVIKSRPTTSLQLKAFYNITK